MAYYLGRDVKVYIATEKDGAGLHVHDTTLKAQAASTGGTKFASDRSTAMNASGQVTDLTGVDLGIGATDEDISYFGQRTVLKAEIKKETTVSLTRKKSDDTWDALFNGARSGLDSTGLLIRDSLSGAPDDVNYGYRLHVKMKNGTEIFVLRNCCVTGHTLSLNVDGTTEETMEFMSYVDPLIVDTDAETYAATAVGDL